jgi:hypothetical protein
MFTEPKSPFASLGVLGGGGAVLLGASQMMGWAMSPADAADLSEALTGLAVSVAGVVAAYGRFRATKRISLKG